MRADRLGRGYTRATHSLLWSFFMSDRQPIRRALISVYDKSGLAELVTALDGAGVEIISTGSTATQISQAGVPVTGVETVTGFPECLDGRVKTLHPKIHAGILADRRKEAHVQELNDLQVEPFDLVVVNLYPFTETVASGATPDECVEQIDIGGPTMVRAAAKNHQSVAVVVSPEAYEEVITAVSGGGFTLPERQRLAAAAFQHTAAYDVAVATWMEKLLRQGMTVCLSGQEKPGHPPRCCVTGKTRTKTRPSTQTVPG